MKTLAERIQTAKSLAALNAACKGFAFFRKPNNYEFDINEYGEPVKYVLDIGDYQNNKKFFSLAEAKDWAEKQSYTI